MNNTGAPSNHRVQNQAHLCVMVMLQTDMQTDMLRTVFIQEAIIANQHSVEMAKHSCTVYGQISWLESRNK